MSKRAWPGKSGQFCRSRPEWKIRISKSGISGKSLEHPRRASPRHAVPVRPGGRIVAAARSPASGAALPHADSVLFAAHHAIRSLSQLAAGSAEQLRRAADVPGKGRRAPRRGRPRGRDGRLQSVRLLPRAVRRTLSVLRTRRRERRELQPFLHDRATHAAVGRAISTASIAARRRTDRLPGRRQPQTAAGHLVRHPARPRSPGRRADARAGIGLVPRHHVAARAALPPPRARRALRVRLSDPADPGRQGAGRTGRRRSATSPISTPGARCTCRAPAGSASIRRRDCSPAKGTFRWPARPSRRAPRRSRAASSHARSSSSTRCRCSGSSNRRASPSPTPTRSGRRSSRADARSTPTCPPATCA